MRWDALFADLEAQADALAAAERAAEVDERTRGEVNALHAIDRLRAAEGAPVSLVLAGGLTLAGRVGRVGPDWLLLDEDGGRETLVVLAHLVRLRGLGRYTAVPGSAGELFARLGLRHALRGIARDRDVVRVLLRDGATVDATVDRVGADFIEVAIVPAGEARRHGAVHDVELVPLGALVAVRRVG
jgi:hypothetical protein